MSISVAFLTASASRRAGGVFWSLSSLANELRNAQCAVQVFAGWDEHAESDRAYWGPVHVQLGRVSGPASFGFTKHLQHALKLHDPDLIHTHGLWMYPSLAAATAGRRLKIPWLVSPHGMLDPWAVGHSKWKKRIASFCYESRHLRGARCIHALCPAEYDAIRSYGLRNPIVVIPNGVTLPNLGAPITKPKWSHGLSSSTRKLLFLGRLHPKKGLLLLLAAWAQAQRRNQRGANEWELVIAGSDESKHGVELVRQLQELRISSSVHLVGPQYGTDKIATLREADAFILPSFSEGLPMAVLEAWSFGLPAIITPECNIPEGFSAEAAIRVQPTVDSVARGLLDLFAMSSDELTAMGSRGRALVERKFEWSSIGGQMAAVYSEIAGK